MKCGNYCQFPFEFWQMILTTLFSKPGERSRRFGCIHRKGPGRSWHGEGRGCLDGERAGPMKIQNREEKHETDGDL
jgi:hypothetical protein